VCVCVCVYMYMVLKMFFSIALLSFGLFYGSVAAKILPARQICSYTKAGV